MQWILKFKVKQREAFYYACSLLNPWREISDKVNTHKIYVYLYYLECSCYRGQVLKIPLWHKVALKLPLVGTSSSRHKKPRTRRADGDWPIKERSIFCWENKHSISGMLTWSCGWPQASSIYKREAILEQVIHELVARKRVEMEKDNLPEHLSWLHIKPYYKVKCNLFGTLHC